LGLAIYKQIVDKHGGTIRVNSAPGQGTTVIVVFLSRESFHESPRDIDHHGLEVPYGPEGNS
jgi:signal transduction histidine kinase